MRIYLALALTAAVALTGCGGGGGGTGLPSGGNGGGGSQQTQSVSENAVASTNAFGSPMKSISDANSQNSPLESNDRLAMSFGDGKCNNGVESFVPDKNGDKNSTEIIYFYDSACTNMAKDVVRVFNQLSSSSETVARSVKFYASGNGTPIAQRDDNVTIINATFDGNGYPKAANGFDRSETNTLNISGVKTINSGDELVMGAASGNVNNFCTDSAGYNATGIQDLGETFGWQGGIASGTRTKNSDGSVTWSSTHAGSVYKGAIGSLNLNNDGTQNTACPIGTPQFTLSGGTSTGSYNIPITATYNAGILQNLTITNATLANGNTLNVTTNSSVPPTSNLFIQGTISNGGSQIATFNCDAFGDGTLTVTSSGKQYVMTDWHVIK